MCYFSQKESPLRHHGEAGDWLTSIHQASHDARARLFEGILHPTMHDQCCPLFVLACRCCGPRPLPATVAPHAAARTARIAVLLIYSVYSCQVRIRVSYSVSTEYGYPVQPLYLQSMAPPPGHRCPTRVPMRGLTVRSPPVPADPRPRSDHSERRLVVTESPCCMYDLHFRRRALPAQVADILVCAVLLLVLRSSYYYSSMHTTVME